MINKDLLNEVLGKADYTLKIYGPDKQRFKVTIHGRDFQDEELSVHELAHKFKMWAWENNYGFEMLPFGISIFNRFNAENIKEICLNPEERRDMIPYKFIIIEKACQWILDNKETK